MEWIRYLGVYSDNSKDVNKLTRIISPKQAIWKYGSQLPDLWTKYYDDYIQKVWTCYSGDRRSMIDSQDPDRKMGIVACGIDADGLLCVSDSNNQEIWRIGGKPTTEDIFKDDSGPFKRYDTCPTWKNNVCHNLVAAFVRSRSTVIFSQRPMTSQEDKASGSLSINTETADKFSLVLLLVDHNVDQGYHEQKHRKYLPRWSRNRLIREGLGDLGLFAFEPFELVDRKLIILFALGLSHSSISMKAFMSHEAVFLRPFHVTALRCILEISVLLDPTGTRTEFQGSVGCGGFEGIECSSERTKYLQHMDLSVTFKVALHELFGHGTGKLLSELSPDEYNFDIKCPPVNPLTGKPIDTRRRGG
ncbi:hypothetical protein TSTA_093760 [Talaromyces stipitatus ATCC 10500]|uniref:GH64 domain-containing protein n=1 Tax=Talaromyces stipitatus (strain ATCC 10500 / CBS 375.48 / QM 6759 / NRRL 1006) TaxID=441959 RepID=B8M1P3_TALSN|nr:uncharacterized protein TSTA_093760 [Talaromyces stipitatus ATCC 10500]EED22130.1 hypothetical protein TSTA_093760 [Talaromyces stipitatus ATCC 10500]